MEETRWVQKLTNFRKAFSQLEAGVKLSSKRELNDLEKEGIIQRFEYNHELAWQTIKSFYEYNGETGIQGSRDAILLAVNRGLIDDKTGRFLMEGIKSRNQTVHTYNEETANQIFQKILNDYFEAFQTVLNNIEKERVARNL